MMKAISLRASAPRHPSRKTTVCGFAMPTLSTLELVCQLAAESANLHNCFCLEYPAEPVLCLHASELNIQSDFVFDDHMPLSWPQLERFGDWGQDIVWEE